MRAGEQGAQICAPSLPPASRAAVGHAVMGAGCKPGVPDLQILSRIVACRLDKYDKGVSYLRT